MTFQPDHLLTCVVIALACSGIAMSFTQGSMFDALRAWIMKQNKLLGELARCFFCLSHWLAFVAVAVYQPRPLQAHLLIDLIVAAFAIVALATLVSGLMFAAFFTAGQVHVMRERMLQANQAPVSERA
ncbi:MAG: DUF1360 domain-containing protein [Pseudomonadota bacterium]|nr:DUF1360 domain-containing protein [Pseudomonadota bacterium]